MKAAILKTEALCWLRYVKKMDYVCTEGGPWSSDVIGVCEGYSLEVEIKVSRADLLAEFRNKKAKHAYYETGARFAPNYFYFLVPPELLEVAMEIIPEKAPRAGILSVGNPLLPDGRRIVVWRRAQNLRGKLKPTESFKRQLMLRMGSELCGLHIALDRTANGQEAAILKVDEIKRAVVDAIITTGPVSEWEEEPDATDKTPDQSTGQPD
jgi:hypothetical protein